LLKKIDQLNQMPKSTAIKMNNRRKHEQEKWDKKLKYVPTACQQRSYTHATAHVLCSSIVYTVV